MGMGFPFGVMIVAGTRRVEAVHTVKELNATELFT